MKEMPNLPDTDCKCWDPNDDCGCVCGVTEKVLRAVVRQDVGLTPEHREWCLNEINSIEGYSRADYESEEDRYLANGVLCAWTDYARDKGLL